MATVLNSLTESNNQHFDTVNTPMNRMAKALDSNEDVKDPIVWQIANQPPISPHMFEEPQPAKPTWPRLREWDFRKPDGERIDFIYLLLKERTKYGVHKLQHAHTYTIMFWFKPSHQISITSFKPCFKIFSHSLIHNITTPAYSLQGQDSCWSLKLWLSAFARIFFLFVTLQSCFAGATG